MKLKNVIKLLFVFVNVCSSSCSGQVEFRNVWGGNSQILNASTFIHEYSGYYCIDNAIGNEIVFYGYKNADNDSACIIAEKIVLFLKAKDISYLLANEVGSIAGFILVVDEKANKILYKERFRAIDSIQTYSLTNDEFLIELFYKTSFSPCVEQQAYCIFSIISNKVYKAFEGFVFKEFKNGLPGLCKTGISYRNKFQLQIDGEASVLEVLTEETRNIRKISKYVFENGKFTETPN